MAIYQDESELSLKIEQVTRRPVRKPVTVCTDTSDFIRIEPGMVLRLAGNDYLVRGHATEGRFGIDDQPKYWVKNVFDLETGQRKIIKFAFYEDFTARIGPFLIRAYRDPVKESRILDLVRNHPNYMQGRTVTDENGQEVRIIEYVRGANLYRYLHQLDYPHRKYFEELFPGILRRLLEAIEALDVLFRNGRQHGDIRSDHLFMENETGRFVWIDFDYQVSHRDYDLWSLGGLLAAAAGKGHVTFHDVKANPSAYPGLNHGNRLTEYDALMVRTHQVANLHKLYPYLPESINRVLANFSVKTDYFYDDLNVLIGHLREAVADFPAPAAVAPSATM